MNTKPKALEVLHKYLQAERERGNKGCVLVTITGDDDKPLAWRMTFDLWRGVLKLESIFVPHRERTNRGWKWVFQVAIVGSTDIERMRTEFERCALFYGVFTNEKSFDATIIYND